MRFSEPGMTSWFAVVASRALGHYIAVKPLSMMAQTIILFALLFVFSGCASPRYEPQASTAAATTSISVPEELHALVEAARARHLKSQYAADYPILRRASATEVRFGKPTGSGIIGVSYYFDASGHYTKSTRWLCDGY